MYAIVHEGKAYSPDGLIRDTAGVPLSAQDADTYNRLVEAQELAHLKTGPEHAFLYVELVHSAVQMEPTPWLNCRGVVHTWTGFDLDTCASVGPRRYVGFGGAYRRAVSCRIFGTLYHGWYFESSGDYCRLKRAKRQACIWDNRQEEAPCKA